MSDFEEEEHEEHVNHEAWVIPYADMLTLLMALFLMMFAMSNLDLQKFEALSQSLGAALNPTVRLLDPQGGSVLPDSGLEGGPSAAELRAEAAEAALVEKETQEQLKLAEESKLEGIQSAIQKRVEGAGLGASVKFRHDARGLVVTVLTDDVLFQSGSADLQPNGLKVLKVFADAVAGVPNEVVVEGHTDSRPISTARYPTNWELSTARATSVLRYLVRTYGFDPDRISAAGYGSERPIASNASVEGQTRNRRVELVIVAEVPTH
jgi:chemotaxis protein MotB